MLDECEEASRSDFLKQLHIALKHTPKGRSKIIITSRSNINITQVLSKSDVIEICLSNVASLNADIKDFVDAQIKTFAFRKDIVEEIQDVLIRGANSMFLWVSLVLDDLRSTATTTTTACDIRERLRILPKTLEGVYKDILSRMKSENRETGIKILRLVVWAMRPLSLQELEIAIALRLEHTSVSQLQDKTEMDLRTVLRSILGPLLKVDETDMVHLVHQSAKDFFLNKDNFGGALDIDNVTRLDLSPFYPNLEQAHVHLGVTCLTYLSFDEFDEFAERIHLADLRSNNYPFYNYAAGHWFDHVIHVKHDQSVRRAFIKLAKSDCKFRNMLNVWGGWPNSYSPPIVVVAKLGWFCYVQDQLEQHIDINAESESRTALHEAADNGDEDIVRLLLEHHANVNAPGCEWSDSPLYVAAKTGHEAIARLLLDYGANVNASECCPLDVAASGGYEAIVRLLLDRGANANGSNNRLPIISAAFTGNKVIVRNLIDHGADVNTLDDISSHSALLAAAVNGHKAVVRLLLKCGAFYYIGSYLKSPIQAAAGNGHFAIVRIFLHRGIDVNDSDKCGGSAIQAAAENGHEALVHLLLDHQAAVDASDKCCGSAIQAAAGNGHEVIVRLLLQHRADVNALDKSGGSAIQAAAKNGHEVVVRLLLDQGANVNTFDKYAGSAVRWAQENGHMTIVRLLLEHGAKLDASKDDFITATENAAYDRSVPWCERICCGHTGCGLA